MKTQADTDADVAAASEAIDQLTTEGLEWRRRAEAAEAQAVKLREERDLAGRCLRDTIGELLPETECAPGCDSYGHAEDCRVYSVLAEFRAMRKERDEVRAEVERLRAALKRIARWFGEFPPATLRTGEVVSYGVAYGSIGERDFMRNIAHEALEVSRSGGLVTEKAPDRSTATGPATAHQYQNGEPECVRCGAFGPVEDDDPCTGPVTTHEEKRR